MNYLKKIKEKQFEFKIIFKSNYEAFLAHEAMQVLQNLDMETQGKEVEFPVLVLWDNDIDVTINIK